MKYIKLFENYCKTKTYEYKMNDNIYKIVIYDNNKKDENPMHGVLSSTTKSSNKNEYNFKDDFVKSDEYLNIKKQNPEADLFVKISKLDGSSLTSVKLKDLINGR
jgi:hypothetical protein